MNNIKKAFADTFADMPCFPKSMTDCERYGMTWGCDEDCPVLNKGECGLYKGVSDFLNEKNEKG